MNSFFKLSFLLGISLLVNNCCKTDNEEEILASNIKLSDQSGKKIPILAHAGLVSFPSEWFGTDAHYQDFIDAGYTYNLAPDLFRHGNVTNPEHNKNIQNKLFAALDKSQTYGIKQIISVHFLDKGVLSDAQLTSLSKHPALIGFYIGDEPYNKIQLNDFKPQIQQVKDFNEKYGSTYFPYITLQGANCESGSYTYPEMAGCTPEPTPFSNFVKLFLKEVGSPMLTMDIYPIYLDPKTGSKKLKPNWFYSLEAASRETKNMGRDLWLFALTAPHKSGNVTHPIPTLSDLRLQMFTNLAYGAQVLEYFTYDHQTDTSMSPAQLDNKRNKTSLYYLAKEINAEIATFSPVFYKANKVWVKHTGQLPYGLTQAEAYTAEVLSSEHFSSVFKNLEITGDGGALVSLLEKGRDRFLMVLNKNLSGKIYVRAEGNGNLYMLNKQAQPILLKSSAQELNSGDYIIYFWKKK